MARAKGEGTIVPITTREGQQRYRVAVTMADGRRIWKQVKTPRQAERVRRELVEARELDLDPTRQTLAGFLRSWIASLRSARRVRPRTADHYELIVERHIIPELGSLKLSSVTARRIQAWIDVDPGAPRTIHHHRAVLRRALNVAVKQRLLSWNPATVAELPRADRDVGAPLSLPEVRALLTATRDDRLHALWRLAVVTGLRQGELLGLAWDDIDGATITVTHQLQRLIDPAERAAARAEHRKPRGSWVRTQPKAARSLTRVAVDAATVAVLDEHRLNMAAERTPDWAYHGLVFVTPAGQPIHQSEVLRLFHEACDRAGIPKRRFHDLRGSSATILRELGVEEDARMARLGHSTTDMARRYARASEAVDRAAATRLGEAIG